MTPCEQDRRRESFPLPRFFRIFFAQEDFKKHIFEFRVLASIRPFVQKPIALQSDDFSSTEMRSSKKRHIVLLLPRVKVFLFFTKNQDTHYYPAVLPQGGLTSKAVGIESV